MAMTIPFWQCLPWEQYSHNGVVSLIKMVYVGVLTASAFTGIKPENIEPDGIHGAAKVDCTTEWFIGENWNCTMSPTAAVISFGENVREPLAPPTRTTCILTIPEGVVPVAPASAADDVADFARAPETLKAARAKVVNCILNDS